MQGGICYYCDAVRQEQRALADALVPGKYCRRCDWCTTVQFYEAGAELEAQDGLCKVCFEIGQSVGKNEPGSNHDSERNGGKDTSGLGQEQTSSANERRFSAARYHGPPVPYPSPEFVAWLTSAGGYVL
ncbi:hypothetical protein FKW77_007899 [Venturia effusa]|uniref:Uncharacterized protein n=1 Tax=Venturia effusa TaxID=50376 RepID=A0A517L1Q4_9PEZI|nr:hypothetical protein FKW77_007899 [Venturia effusa]